jgi:probable phosphoglycerate mutase
MESGDGFVVIHLVRHAESEWNKDRVQGQSNPPLSAKGWHQADAVGKALANWPRDLVISSPLQRAVDTAGEIRKQHAMVCGNPTFEPGGETWAQFDGLCEHHRGEIQGRRKEEVQAERTATDVRWRRGELDYPCPGPGGEAPAAVLRRVQAAVAEACAQHPGAGTIMCVTHANALKWLVLDTLQMPYREVDTLGEVPAGCCAVRSVACCHLACQCPLPPVIRPPPHPAPVLPLPLDPPVS